MLDIASGQSTLPTLDSRSPITTLPTPRMSER